MKTLEIKLVGSELGGDLSSIPSKIASIEDLNNTLQELGDQVTALDAKVTAATQTVSSLVTRYQLTHQEPDKTLFFNTFLSVCESGSQLSPLIQKLLVLQLHALNFMPESQPVIQQLQDILIKAGSIIPEARNTLAPQVTTIHRTNHEKSYMRNCLKWPTHEDYKKSLQPFHSGYSDYKYTPTENKAELPFLASQLLPIKNDTSSSDIIQIDISFALETTNARYYNDYSNLRCANEHSTPYPAAHDGPISMQLFPRVYRGVEAVLPAPLTFYEPWRFTSEKNTLSAIDLFSSLQGLQLAILLDNPDGFSYVWGNLSTVHKGDKPLSFQDFVATHHLLFLAAEHGSHQVLAHMYEQGATTKQNLELPFNAQTPNLKRTLTPLGMVVHALNQDSIDRDTAQQTMLTLITAGEDYHAKVIDELTGAYHPRKTDLKSFDKSGLLDKTITECQKSKQSSNKGKGRASHEHGPAKPSSPSGDPVQQQLLKRIADLERENAQLKAENRRLKRDKTTPHTAQRKQPKVCTFFAEDRCHKGDSCTYSHDLTLTKPM